MITDPCYTLLFGRHTSLRIGAWVYATPALSQIFVVRMDQFMGASHMETWWDSITGKYEYNTTQLDDFVAHNPLVISNVQLDFVCNIIIKALSQFEWWWTQYAGWWSPGGKYYVKQSGPQTWY